MTTAIVAFIIAGFCVLIGYVIRDLDRICRGEHWDGRDE